MYSATSKACLVNYPRFTEYRSRIRGQRGLLVCALPARAHGCRSLVDRCCVFKQRYESGVEEEECDVRSCSQVVCIEL